MAHFALCARVLGPNCRLAGREAKVSNNRFGGYLRVSFSLLLVFLFPLHGYGQSRAAGTNPASPADSQQVAASALQELEAMKHRIEVLEAEIRRLKGQENPQTAADSDPPAAAAPAGNAVVVAGSRAITSGPGFDWGLSLYTPVIVKYRDSKTDTKIQLEHLLR